MLLRSLERDRSAADNAKPPFARHREVGSAFVGNPPPPNWHFGRAGFADHCRYQLPPAECRQILPKMQLIAGSSLQRPAKRPC